MQQVCVNLVNQYWRQKLLYTFVYCCAHTIFIYTPCDNVGNISTSEPRRILVGRAAARRCRRVWEATRSSVGMLFGFVSRIILYIGTFQAAAAAAGGNGGRYRFYAILGARSPPSARAAAAGRNEISNLSLIRPFRIL